MKITKDALILAQALGGGGGITPSGTISISSNGSHNVEAFATAEVLVPASAVDVGTKSISENGTHDVVGYANVDVNVPFELGEVDLSPYFNKTLTKATINSAINNMAFPSFSMLSLVYAPNVTSVPYGAFSNCTNLETITLSSGVTSIGALAFMSCGKLTLSVDFPNCTTVGSQAFYRCFKVPFVSLPAFSGVLSDYTFLGMSNCSTFYIPNATSIGTQCFNGCGIVNASFPNVQRIGNGAFGNCHSLETVYFPSCWSVYEGAFYLCEKLNSADFPLAQTVASSMFSNCSGLKYASFPVASYIYQQAFKGCTALETVYAPSCQSIGGNAFYRAFSAGTVIPSTAFANCIHLYSGAFAEAQVGEVNFPAVTTVGSNCFASCYNTLSIARFASPTIRAGAFDRCYRLTSLTLSGSSVAILDTSNAFYLTPIAGYSTVVGIFGSIYVPSSLLTSYQTATNWVYFSSRMVGI